MGWTRSYIDLRKVACPYWAFRGGAADALLSSRSGTLAKGILTEGKLLDCIGEINAINGISFSWARDLPVEVATLFEDDSAQHIVPLRDMIITPEKLYVLWPISLFVDKDDPSDTAIKEKQLEDRYPYSIFKPAEVLIETEIDANPDRYLLYLEHVAPIINETHKPGVIENERYCKDTRNFLLEKAKISLPDNVDIRIKKSICDSELELIDDQDSIQWVIWVRDPDADCPEEEGLCPPVDALDEDGGDVTPYAAYNCCPDCPGFWKAMSNTGK